MAGVVATLSASIAALARRVFSGDHCEVVGKCDHDVFASAEVANDRRVNLTGLLSVAAQRG